MNCNNLYKKSVLDAYSIASTNVAVNALVPFTTNYIKTGVSISDSVAASTINLNKSGIYLITFGATVANQAASAGDVTIQIYRNGTEVPGAVATESSSGPTDLASISISTIIQVDDVCPCSGMGYTNIPITFVNKGVASVISNVKIVAIKLA